MKIRSMVVATLVLALSVTLVTPALAQTEISVKNPAFSWTGKSGQQANYSWSAIVDNPSGKKLNVRVTIELLDNSGSVVGSDSREVLVPKRDQANLDVTANLAFADAKRASQYRIVLSQIE